MSTGVSNKIEPVSNKRRQGLTAFAPLLAVFGVLITVVLVYLAYDFASARSAPCESIFKQASISLKTKISFLKAKGEVSIGHDKLAELSERAQMTALNLKTCCTVLDVGRLNPEQFLQCKAKARAYNSELGEISTVVAQVKTTDQAKPFVSQGAEAKQDPPPQKMSVEQARTRIDKSFQEARKISQTFNREIVAVRQAQAIETLKFEKPKEVSISAQEREPNNDGLNTNVIPLDKWISASISNGKDADVFAFKTPPTYRDWILVEIDNRSTELEPRIELFDANKASLGQRHSKTPGSTVQYRFVSEPNKQYLARVSNYYGNSSGGYLLRASTSKAYDGYEPNDDMLTARPIDIATEIKAKVMDGKDVDYYQVNIPDNSKKLQISMINTSSTLRPRIDVYGGDKGFITHRYNTTSGADIAISIDVKTGGVFRVRVTDYYGSAAGSYKLFVTHKE